MNIKVSKKTAKERCKREDLVTADEVPVGGVFVSLKDWDNFLCGEDIKNVLIRTELTEDDGTLWADCFGEHELFPLDPPDLVHVFPNAKLVI